MKTELENFRKYSLSDFLVNTKKFKDYLEYCKKKNIISEKKDIIDRIIKTLQDKENSQNANIITGYQNLCALAIIFSDFEVELFFEIEHFNLDLQKTIFLQTINYCYDRQKESQNYISSKFQYWMLKIKNHSYVSLIENKNLINEDEINESIESLKKCFNQELFNHIEDNVKILYLKIIYELGIYYYFNNNYQESIKYLVFLEKNMKTFSNLQKYLYFELNSITNLLSYLNKNIDNHDNKDDNDIIDNKCNKNDDILIDTNDVNLLSSDNDETINTNEIMNEDYNNYLSEIKQTKDEILSVIDKKMNLSEDINKKGYIYLLKYLKISEYLFHITFDNFNNYNELNKFVNQLKNIIEDKINKVKTKEENDYYQYLNKELLYHSILLQILDSMVNNQKQLPKDFIINLSNIIIKNTFTDNISISGLIHSSIINFDTEYKIIYRYFNKFVEFFQGTNSPFKKEIINQAIFIARIISVFFIILDSKAKINSLGEKEIIVNIEKELHVNIINIFLFWLEKEIKNDDNKKELKYPPSINIIYILIETLKILDFLKIYKIIVLGVLEFLLNKKHAKENANQISGDEKNEEDINEFVKHIKQKIFKISTLSEEELRQNKKIINNENLYYSIKVNFVEAKGKDKYILNSNDNNIDFYIDKLFEIVELIENKIREYENRNYGDIVLEEQNIKSKDNLKLASYSKLSEKKDFLYSFCKVLECENKNVNVNINKISNFLLIKKGINYMISSMNDVKIKNMKIDINNNQGQINRVYELFKKNLNQEVLSQLILCFIKNNLFLESIVLIQYSKLFNNNFEYKIIKAFYEQKKSIDNICFKYIWKITYFEFFANIFSKNNDKENLEKIKRIVKKIGNHRFFKEHPLRKHFKIINFFNFLEYLNSISFNHLT